MAVVHALSVCGMRQYMYRTRQIVVFFFIFWRAGMVYGGRIIGKEEEGEGDDDDDDDGE